jgi:hypothetical protein
MKQQTKSKTTADSQNRKSIKDGLSGGSTIFSASELINIFLVQNKGKGPPGRIRSPVAGYCLEPDNYKAAKSRKMDYKSQFQYFNNYHFSIFYSHN